MLKNLVMSLGYPLYIGDNFPVSLPKGLKIDNQIPDRLEVADRIYHCNIFDRE